MPDLEGLRQCIIRSETVNPGSKRDATALTIRENLAWIQDIVGVKRGFEAFHQGNQFGLHHEKFP